MRVLLKEDLARLGVWTSIIPAIMEIVMSFQRLVRQHQGSETVPDHVIVQDPRKGDKEKLGLIEEEKKKQQKSKRSSVQKASFLDNRNPSFPSMLNDSAKGVCRRCGPPGHYASVCRAAIPPYRPGPPPASQQQPGFP